MIDTSIFVVLVKEFAESIVRRCRLLFRCGSLFPESAELTKNGIEIIGSMYTHEQCNAMRNRIDALLKEGNTNVWRDSEEADSRIYFADHLDDVFADFYNNSKIRSYLHRYLGVKEPEGMVLAAKISYKNGNKGSGGGWHRDSPIRHQLKAICYLSDVGLQNGPFQVIKKSHSKSDIIKSYLKGIFKPGQYRFEDQEINNYLHKNKRDVYDVVAPEGTLLLADTKALHRGKPIEAGVRYVLFCYFWDKSIPPHFAQYKQHL